MPPERTQKMGKKAAQKKPGAAASPKDGNYVPKKPVASATPRASSRVRRAPELLQEAAQAQDAISASSSSKKPDPPQGQAQPEPTFTSGCDTSTFLASFDSDIHELATFFRDSAANNDLRVELPGLTSEANPDIKWTAETLIQLYLVSYHNRDWNTCDLITDTWIRAFHKLDSEPLTKIWREQKIKCNPAIEIPPNDNGNPDLHHHVTSFDPRLLTQLYEYTEKDCGARNMWADAMALVGERLESTMESIGQGRWHKDLIWNIMRTCMRLVRARRTLKIEEKQPGAWCKRYHEHARHGTDCYRVIATAVAGKKRRADSIERGEPADTSTKRVKFTSPENADEYSEED
ncbi:hypothetical protein CC78DRAFT_619124 [Lojkania enalia]|uniref:Uncharacterized protein n=1 Tax=Lojkania enalia TaxID=147567 RepID=A0A9P4K455_9PLEO|nr:hypothetical protein CC78DRAFT_619124 [Didymosphaeria enalia]